MFPTTDIEPTQLSEAAYVEWQQRLEDTRPAPTAPDCAGPDFGPGFTPPY
jgi:hypothetical protein